MRQHNLRCLKDDPYLEPFFGEIDRRALHVEYMEKKLTGEMMSLEAFSNAHEYYGLHFRGGKWIFREWAPNATAIYLIGDFSNWQQKEEFAMGYGDGDGVWEIELPAEKIRHEDLYKLMIYWPGGCGERVPSYSRRVVQDEDTKIFSAQVWHPQVPYEWTCPDPKGDLAAPLIYESHVGMALEEERVGTYIEYTELILPRIKEAGYNTVQLMGIMEHPYYGSFGYHVSSFFAASSRFGTPEELKKLVDTAHEMGLCVIIDLIHSHAVKNEVEGLSRFDGTPYQYFHDGDRGDHTAWDSRCFDYGKTEVLHFLLSNAHYWLDEFKFDGFRFDGVTSMLYHHRGLGSSFMDYGSYFDGSADLDAYGYLALSNKLIHQVRPHAITIAEDVSGMPGLGAEVQDGGCGFDYRLAMGVPDCWFKLVNDISDENWSMNWLYHELTNRRADEKIISYVESHDQALVGGKTFIFELIDAEMYYNMHKDSHNLIVDRGMALHKMARLATIGAAAHGYLNFMGNEFGHPEWIDFPREGNGWSYKYAQRKWSLRENNDLKFHYLADFDKEMVNLIRERGIVAGNNLRQIYCSDMDKLLFFQHGDLYFFFNFNPTCSFADFPVDVPEGEYHLLLNTDEPRFGGSGLVEPDQHYYTMSFKEGDVTRHQVKVYVPARTALVIELVKPM